MMWLQLYRLFSKISYKCQFIWLKNVKLLWIKVEPQYNQQVQGFEALITNPYSVSINYCGFIFGFPFKSILMQ